MLETLPSRPAEAAPARPDVIYRRWLESRSISEPHRPPKRGFGERWLPPLVLVAAITCALGVFAHFCQQSRALWWWIAHDRHTHYMFGLNLALDLGTGEVARLIHDFDRMRVWGPLHPILVTAVQLVGGPDHRLAVLPSLCGWVLAIWCAFLIPRRLLAAGGNAAGLIAACMVAASPAHRAFAADVMLESLGAGLSLAAIYLYLVVLQENSRRHAIALGLTLTALFFHKYNYWLLVVLGLLIGEFVRQPVAWLRYGRSLCRRDALVGELRQPLNWLAVVLAAIAIVISLTGGGTIALGRWTLSVQAPHNFVHLAYVAGFMRLAWWWLKIGRAWSVRAMPADLRTVLLWHVTPAALWFLLPKRLGYFLWYLSPANDDQRRDSVTLLHGLPTYLVGLREDYLPLSWGMALFAGMLLLGIAVLAAGSRGARRGAAALLCFFLGAAFLTCQHPMLKYRFLHSWIAAGWIIGAVGLIFCVRALVGWIAPAWRNSSARIACSLLIAAHAPALLAPGHAQEGGLKADRPSPLRITDAYLPALASAKNPTILSNVSARSLWTWTFIEAHGRQNVVAEIKNFKSFAGQPALVQRWLETTPGDALVLIDVHPGSVYDLRTDDYVDLAACHAALGQQSAWAQSERWELPEGVSITLWRKR